MLDFILQETKQKEEVTTALKITLIQTERFHKLRVKYIVKDLTK